MGFLKKLFGLDKKSTSTTKEVLKSNVEGNTIPVTSMDSIITYKREDDMVYGYLNQKTLDSILYNRAKERTHNFKDKDQWENERSKRPVTLSDISTNDHTLCNLPIEDGEYVSEGDIILVIGLDNTRFSNYCTSNRVSLYETMLYCGVNIYSSYSGYFSNNIIFCSFTYRKRDFIIDVFSA